MLRVKAVAAISKFEEVVFVAIFVENLRQVLVNEPFGSVLDKLKLDASTLQVWSDSQCCFPLVIVMALHVESRLP